MSITIKYSWLLLTAVVALACATVRNAERSRREAKECYELYLDVMATRKTGQQMLPLDAHNSLAGMERAELTQLIRWRERQIA